MNKFLFLKYEDLMISIDAIESPVTAKGIVYVKYPTEKVIISLYLKKIYN